MKGSKYLPNNQNGIEYRGNYKVIKDFSLNDNRRQYVSKDVLF